MKTRGVISLVTVLVFLASALLVGNVSAFTAEEAATIAPFCNGFEDGEMTGITRKFTEVYTVNTELAHSGDYSLKVEGRRFFWEGPQINLMGKMIKGQTYYFSAWVYQDSGLPQDFRFTAYSRDDTSEDPYDGKFYTTVGENLEVPSGEWTRLEGLYTYNYEGNPLEFLAYLEATEVDFTFYCDDIVIAGPSVINSGFEDGKIAGWSGKGSEVLSASTDFANTGDYSMKVAGRTQFWEGPETNLTGNLVKGQTYYVSAWVYQDSGAPQTIRLTAYSLDDSSENPYDGKFYTTVAENLELPSGVWTRMEGLYTYNYTGTPMKLTLYLESPETGFDFYVDDIVIAGQQKEKDDSAVCNTSFEESFDGWTAQGTGIDAQVSIDETLANTGVKSLKVTGRQDSWQGARYDLVGKVEKGQAMDLSLWLYQETGSEQQMRVSICTDAEGDPSYNTIALDGAVPSGVWTELKGSHTISYTGEVEQLFIYVETDDKTMDFNIDDVLITVPNETGSIETDIPSLKDVFADYFPIGVAVPPSTFDNELQSALIKKHFNSITAENDMKPASMQPTEGTFAFAKGDRYVDFAQENDMRLRGHTLVWHQAVPSWIFVDAEGNYVTREVLLDRMKTHIETLVQYYGDKVEIWDVVNEAIGDNQPYGLRNSEWRQIIGDDFVVKAFEYTYQALVDAGLEGKVKLYYNDYNNEENPLKREAILELVKELKEKTHIDGVGYQCHVGIDFGSVEGIRESLKGFLDLGLEVEITELDMTVYKSFTDPDAPITEEQLIKQGYKYKEIAEMLKELDAEYPDKIKGVTFWGLKDDMTWLNYFAEGGRTDMPLLFDKYCKAKYAYWGLVDPSKLPVFVNNVISLKGTPAVDGEEDSVWGVTNSIDIKDSEGVVNGSFKTLWDDQNLYAYMKVVDGAAYSLKEVEFFVDEDNSKGEVSEGDSHFTVTSSGETTGGASASVIKVEGGYELEVCMPLTTAPSAKIGFDVRLGYGEGEPVLYFSWNDTKNNQETDTSGYGVLSLINPKYTEAVKGTPSIDGEIESAWANANEIVTDLVTQGTEPAKAKVKTMWDENYLYVMAEVTDAQLSDISTNPWEQDSVELFVDENNGRTAAYEPDDAQYRVNFMNVPSFNGGCIQDEYVTAAKVLDNGEGYVVEAAIPFNTISGTAGHVMGFDVQINDDSDGDGVRDGMSNWNDTTGVGWKNTEAFGLLKLVESEKTSKLSGYVKPDMLYVEENAAALQSGFIVEIIGTDLKVETDENGYFEILGVPEKVDGYTVKISKPNYLYTEIRGLDMAVDTEVNIKMWAGDMIINGSNDNAINLEDIMYVCRSFNSVRGDGRYRADRDINKDGAVNMEDLMIISKHFNKTPEDCVINAIPH